MNFNNEVLNLINNSTNVAIVAHVRPDADCLGSASALKGALLSLNKRADIYCDGEISENFHCLPFIREVNQPVLGSYDLVVAVDCNDIDRTGEYGQLFRTHENTLSIDHHMTDDIEKTRFTKVLVKEEISSTAEMLYYLFKQLGVKFCPQICTGIYAGILTDTGGFLHSNTTADTHKVISESMEFIPDVSDINYNLLKKRTVGQINVLKIALRNLKYICNGKVAITYLTENDFKSNGLLTSENYGIVDTCVNIDSVDIGILISEKSKNLYACSLRGKGRDVSIIASHFGGGGHKPAAGCNIFGSYNAVIRKLEKAINELYDRLS